MGRKKKRKILPEPKGRKTVIDLKRGLPDDLGTIPTGKRFKCIGLKEHFCEGWSSAFELNQIYFEGTNPLVENIMRGQSSDNKMICLMVNQIGLIVDEINFKLITE